jgi:multiple sugar transport system ATP-binding protein
VLFRSLPLDDASRARLAAQPAALYGVRPEDLALAGDGPLAGTIAMLEPTGPETYVKLDTPVGPLTARVPGHVAQPVGAPVRLAWAPERVHLFHPDSGLRLN